MPSAKSILIFACGPLQRSIIRRARGMGLFTVGIDPNPEAPAKDEVDAFEVVGGQDFEGTCAVVEKYGISAIVTAAADKPLRMMARIAEKYGFPFYSADCASWSTDKFLMKERFELFGIGHARGRLVSSAADARDLRFPLIVKPRDNSGSRGVVLSTTPEELEQSIADAFQYSRLDSVLVEEFIDGSEYSIEALHHGGRTEIIQFTEKETTEFPYNVELGHRQPAPLSEESMDAVRKVIERIAEALDFDNCPSHTELKINSRGIFVIETSPRLGGDFITSDLVPLSTGINIEDQLLRLALGEPIDTESGRVQRASAVQYFHFSEGIVKSISPSFYALAEAPGVTSFDPEFKVGDRIRPITSSLNRYGSYILSAPDRESLLDLIDNYNRIVNDSVSIDKCN